MQFFELSEWPILHAIPEPEYGFELVSVEVRVAERRIRATWTPEMAQDIRAFHNIDAEAELTALLAEHIRQDNPVIAHRGQTILENGYVYAPYIPLQMPPIVVGNNFNPAQQLATRYAHRMVNRNLYETIHIANADYPEGLGVNIGPKVASTIFYMFENGVEFQSIQQMELPRTKNKSREMLKNRIMTLWDKMGLTNHNITIH